MDGRGITHPHPGLDPSVSLAPSDPPSPLSRLDIPTEPVPSSAFSAASTPEERTLFSRLRWSLTTASPKRKSSSPSTLASSFSSSSTSSLLSFPPSLLSKKVGSLLAPEASKKIPQWWVGVFGFLLAVGGGVGAIFLAAKALRAPEDPRQHNVNVNINVNVNDDVKWLVFSIVSSSVAISASLACVMILAISRLRPIIMNHRAYIGAIVAAFAMVLIWIVPLVAYVNEAQSAGEYTASPLGQALLFNIGASFFYVLALIWTTRPTPLSEGLQDDREWREECSSKS